MPRCPRPVSPGRREWPCSLPGVCARRGPRAAPEASPVPTGRSSAAGRELSVQLNEHFSRAEHYILGSLFNRNHYPIYLLPRDGSCLKYTVAILSWN